MKKVGSQTVRGVVRIIISEEHAAELFPCTQYLAAARAAPALIRGREVEELERAAERIVKARAVPCRVRANRALDFAAHMGELLHQRQVWPAPSCLTVTRPGRAHPSLTSVSTIRRILSRVTSSSTSRLRFPCVGRTLIIESNSIQLSLSSQGYRLIPQRCCWLDPSSSSVASSSECNSPPIAMTARSTSTTALIM